MEDVAKGRLKFSQTSCYLCSEWLDDSDVEDHLRACRKQKALCPNGCGRIVALKDLQLHQNTCPKSYGDLMEGEEPTNEHDAPSTSDTEDDGEFQHIGSLMLGEALGSIETELKCVKLVVTELTSHKQFVQTELARLSKYIDISQKWSSKVYDSIVALNKLCYNEKIQRTLELTAIQQKLASNEIWNLDIGNRFDRVEEKIFFLIPHDTAEVVDGSRTDANAHETTGVQNPLSCDTDTSPGTKSKLEQVFDKPKPEATTSSSPEGTAASMASQAVSNSKLVQEMVAEFKAQYAKINVEVKDTMTHLFETAERIHALEKLVERYRRETYHTKQRSDELQQNLMLANARTKLASETGHVIWRIDNFAQKLKESKELETMIKGPIFTNQPYGYMMQMEASPYGIGTWRGRNLIAGLTILPGPYDPLLEWPCRLTATLILRDQPNKREEAKNVCKPIVAKAKGQRDPNQHYVFISHEVLFANSYLNNDTIFLELIIASEDGKSVN